MPDKPVLITGINGFVASHLAERLLREGQPVRGLARRPETASWIAAQGAEIVAGDLLDPSGLAAAVDGCGAVVHAAAWTGGPELPPESAWHTNVTATQHLADACGVARARFIFISSVAVYGLNPAPIIDETADTPPVGQLYPDTKIAAEAAVRRCAAPWVIVRLACTYGPRGTAWTVGPIERIKAGQLVLLGEDTGLANTGYIDNVVDGLLLALSHPAAIGEAFNILDGTAVTYRRFYCAYARMLGREPLPQVPAWLAGAASLPPASLARRLMGRPSVGPWSLHFRRNPSLFSIDKAAHVLGFRPEIGFEEGMCRTEAWLREAGHLG